MTKWAVLLHEAAIFGGGRGPKLSVTQLARAATVGICQRCWRSRTRRAARLPQHLPVPGPAAFCGQLPSHQPIALLPIRTEKYWGLPSPRTYLAGWSHRGRVDQLSARLCFLCLFLSLLLLASLFSTPPPARQPSGSSGQDRDRQTEQSLATHSSAHLLTHLFVRPSSPFLPWAASASTYLGGQPQNFSTPEGRGRSWRPGN